MIAASLDLAAGWRAKELESDRSWVYRLDDPARDGLARAAKAAWQPDRELFSYSLDEFDLGPAWPVIDAALGEAKRGRGLALVKNLPRDGLSEDEFALMNWAIGLYAGVARPQGKASHYVSKVRDAGTDYRSSTGRGYSSNAALDFHVDGADIATLACYNTARSGGQSMITSSVTAHAVLAAERPDLAELAYGDFCFSRQGEEAPDEPPFYAQPLFEELDGNFFSKWNRNRVQSAQKLDGVPPLTPRQHELMDLLDAILRRPELMYTMYLEPGDLQIMNNHVLLHSRTNFIDHEDEAKKRCLFRLWLAPPDSVLLPESWGHFYRSVTPGSVRGGILGHEHGEDCLAFERRQAEALGMTLERATV